MNTFMNRLLSTAAMSIAVTAFAGAAAAADFTRIASDAHGNPTALQLAIVKYGAVSGNDELAVDLISAIHIGDSSYYENLNDRFDAYDVVLYELVIRDETETTPNNPNPMNMLSASQVFLKNLLGLAFQLDEIDYSAPNFVHADMTAAMLGDSMADRGESLYVYAWRTFLVALDEYAKDPLGLRDLRVLGRMVAHRQNNGLKTAIAYEMADERNMRDYLGGEQGSALIAARNARAMQILQEQIDAGARRIGIFYGVAHMPDFEQRLADELSLVRQQTDWINAWQLDQMAGAETR